jgi:nucleoside-diphosphate-sugar epimerase
MYILLTGATGFLGFRTLEQLVLLEDVQQIVAVGRTIKPTHHVDHPKVTYQLGDLNNPAFVEKVVEGCTHIIHAAALSSPWGRYEDFYLANVVTQQNLLKAAKKNHIERYVYISSPSIYFEYKHKQGIKESDALPAKFINAYAETKRLGEIELEKAGVPYVSLRPRALIGRGDTVIMPRLIRAFDEGRLKIIGNGENVVDLTSVANVVDAIILSLKADQKAINNIYNISNGAPLKLWDAIADVLQKLGRKPPRKKVSANVVRFVAQIMETKSMLTNKAEPVLTKYGVGTLAKTFTMDISKAKRLLGYEPKTTTQQAIDEFVSWYISHEKD